MPLFVGTSGWQYDDWRGNFYPPGLPKARWRDYYAAEFQTVEVNNTFYRLPEAKTFALWGRETPDDFILAIKASRYLTHIKRLKDPEEPVGLLMERAGEMGTKLGPVLVQLPPHFEADIGRLRDTLAAFPRSTRVTVEFRDDTWFTEAVYETLGEFNAALCLADRGSRPITPTCATADWGYLRFHAGTASPRPCYGRSALASWAERISDLWPASADVFVYFNNDTNCCAVRDARVFARVAERAGLHPTRVAEESEVVGV